MVYVLMVIACGIIGQMVGLHKGYRWRGLILGALLTWIGVIIICCMKPAKPRAAITRPGYRWSWDDGNGQPGFVRVKPAAVPQLPRADASDKAHMRVTTAQRNVVADELSKQFAAGTLDQETFDMRMSTALSATMQFQLDALTMDLPVLP